MIRRVGDVDAGRLTDDGVAALIAASPPGATVRLDIERAGARRSIDVELGGAAP